MSSFPSSWYGWDWHISQGSGKEKQILEQDDYGVARSWAEIPTPGLVTWVILVKIHMAKSYNHVRKEPGMIAIVLTTSHNMQFFLLC